MNRCLEFQNGRTIVATGWRLTLISRDAAGYRNRSRAASTAMYKVTECPAAISFSQDNARVRIAPRKENFPPYSPSRSASSSPAASSPTTSSSMTAKVHGLIWRNRPPRGGGRPGGRSLMARPTVGALRRISNCTSSNLSFSFFTSSKGSTGAGENIYKSFNNCFQNDL